MKYKSFQLHDFREMQVNMAYSDVIQMKNLGANEVIYEEPKLRLDETEDKHKEPSFSASPRNDRKKKRVQIKRFEIVSAFALTLAVLALVLVLIQYTSSLNQNQRSVSQEQLQALKVQLTDNLVAIQAQMNKSNAEVRKRYEQEIRLQEDNLMQELQILRHDRNLSSQLFEILKVQQANITQEIETSSEATRQYAINFINSELSALQTNFSTLENQIQSIGNTLVRLEDCCTEMLNRSSTIVPDGNCSQRGTLSEPASSCKDLCQGNPSGEYWIQANRNSSVIQVHCDHSPRNCSPVCNSTMGSWMRVANIDMADPNQQCPNGFKLINRTEPPLRTCGRPVGSGRGCVPTTFPVHGIQYSHVCGRIIGYQFGSPSGFGTKESSIDRDYMAGISLTHGHPRQHIWSFVNAQNEVATGEVCPCIQGSTDSVPLFVGSDYFCDSAVEGNRDIGVKLYPDDPLWDGRGCGSTSTCCEFNTPPSFCKQLPQPTADDIELRLCENSDSNQDDSPFEIVQLYIN